MKTKNFGLRKYFLVSNLELAAIFVVTFHAGASMLFPEYRFEIIPTHITFGLLICYALVLTVKDYKDYDGDKRSHIQTVYTLLGQRTGSYVTGFFVCSVILLVPVLLHIPQLMVFSAIICLLFVLSIMLVKQQKAKEAVVTLLYFAYMFVVFYTLVFEYEP